MTTQPTPPTEQADSSGSNACSTAIEDLLVFQRGIEMWGYVYDFQPMLIDKVFGDGKRLMQVFPIMERPRYWVLRVDSECKTDDDFLEIVDDVYEAIEDQFGSPDEEDLGVGDDRPYYPATDGDGFAWHFCR